MEIKTIALFGKPLFNLVTMTQPIKMATAMPEDEAGFVYILQGRCTNYSETEELRLKANQAVLAKCGNSTFSTLTINGKTEYKAIAIKFHKDVLEKLYHNVTSPFSTRTWHKLSVNSTLVETNELLRNYIIGLISYFEHPELVSEDLLKLKLNELILLLIHTANAPEVIGIMTNLYEKKTFEFKEIIDAHIYSSLGIEELAQLNNQSLSTFKKTFKRIYNDTPNNYLIRKRIEKVAELLPVSNESITNIAYQCEFKTLAHMSRVFKAQYGISPSEYRLNFSDKG
ncbi:AraC family transcriptional regulator [Aquimarina sp. RZ0]|uniref:helix-turn-helix domain-containing protein n=1 Tax=Aquimarina sp. RZ0 TaxID=2607730 RepID=UPI0011F26CF9|nr:AraC family transcriptional regulator [Aquimarina sp. RZ0]KAA1244375.1 helix-turn-helix transcriptional regulator [Aquimarina sp. RZ0]